MRFFFCDPFGQTSFKSPSSPVWLVFVASSFESKVGERTAPGGIFRSFFSAEENIGK